MTSFLSCFPILPVLLSIDACCEESDEDDFTAHSTFHLLLLSSSTRSECYSHHDIFSGIASASRIRVSGQILLSADDWWGVLRAAEDLAGDFGKVTGKNLTLANWQSSNVTKKRDVATASFNPPGGPSGFPYGPPLGNLPPSPGHNKTQSQGTSTTVYYTFNPVTSLLT